MTTALQRANDQRRGFYNTSFRVVRSNRFSLQQFGFVRWLLSSDAQNSVSEFTMLQFDGWSSGNESRRFDPSVWLCSNNESFPARLLRVTYAGRHVCVWLQVPGRHAAKFKVILSAAERSVFFAWIRRFDRQQDSLASRLHCWLKAAPQQ